MAVSSGRHGSNFRRRVTRDGASRGRAVRQRACCRGDRATYPWRAAHCERSCLYARGMGSEGLLLAAAMVFVGCGNDGSPMGSATVTGTLPGNAFLPMDAISIVNRDNGAAAIEVDDFPGACALGANLKANAQRLTFLPQIGPTSARAYDVPSEYYVAYASDDATCHVSIDTSASQGTVTISKIDGSGIEGTFDLTFSTGHVTGSFDTATCSPAPVGTSISCM